MMTNEKPGGHGERSVAVGTIDMAVWDAVAKIAEKPLFRLLAERYGNGAPDPKVFVYAAGGFPDGVKVQDGYVTMLELPGIGFEGKADLYREMKALSN
jgi:L-alanine-DL-glutamate epimerase-like enolase superfamily enzyme